MVNKLSLYVVETIHNNQPVLFNTVTRKHFAIDTPEEILLNNYFFEGSEQNALWAQLTKPTTKAAFTIVNTWECNLRCTHCTVTHKLLKNDPIELDAEATVEFIKRFKDYYNIPHTILTFLGGEPLLRPKTILECMKYGGKYGFRYGITTNLTIDFNDDIWQIMKQLSSIGVSLDGIEHIHNKQRRSLTLTSDPFWTTVNNLRKLVMAGMADKLSVQGAIADEFLTEEHRKSYYTLLLRLGIKFDKIKFACQHPTVKNPNNTQSFNAVLKSDSLKAQVCCKYRQHNFVVDRNGDVFADYYTWEKIGHISDSIESISKMSCDIIARMPALYDSKCKVCPVIGYCWGGCVNGSTVIGDNPSKYCDQENLIKAVASRAKLGKLI